MAGVTNESIAFVLEEVEPEDDVANYINNNVHDVIHLNKNKQSDMAKQ